MVCGVGADDNTGAIEGTLGPAPTEAAPTEVAPTEAEHFSPSVFFPELSFVSMSTYCIVSLDCAVSFLSTKAMTHTSPPINQCLSPQYMH
jgi:hypothetical protein